MATLEALRPSVVAEHEPTRAAVRAHPGGGLRDAAANPLLLEPRPERPGSGGRIAGEQHAVHDVPLHEDVPRLLREDPRLDGFEAVCIGLCEDRLDRCEDCHPPLDLAAAKVHRFFDLSLLGSHRGPFGPRHELTGEEDLFLPERTSGLVEETLRLGDVRADVVGLPDERLRCLEPLLDVLYARVHGLAREPFGVREGLEAVERVTSCEGLAGTVKGLVGQGELRTDARRLVQDRGNVRDASPSPLDLARMERLGHTFEAPQEFRFRPHPSIAEGALRCPDDLRGLADVPPGASAVLDEPLAREDRVRPCGPPPRLLGARECGGLAGECHGALEVTLVEVAPCLREDLLSSADIDRRVLRFIEEAVDLRVLHRRDRGPERRRNDLGPDFGRRRALRQRDGDFLPLPRTGDIDAMASGEVPQLGHLPRGEEELEPREVDSRGGCFEGHDPRPFPEGRDKSTAGRDSRQRFRARPVLAEYLDRPLHLPELVGVASDIRMELPCEHAVPGVNRLGRGPSVAKPRRLDSSVLESEDPERGTDPLRLKIELPQIRLQWGLRRVRVDVVPRVVPAHDGVGFVAADARVAEVRRPGGHGRGIDFEGKTVTVAEALSHRRPMLHEMAFREGPSVFKDRSKVSFDYVPEKLPHREAQLQRLFSIFRPLAEAGGTSNAFLWGSVGTGKTHTARRFCLELQRYANERGRGLDFVPVNCRQKMGDDAVLLHILKHFDAHTPERGFSIAEKYEILRRHLEKRNLHLIVILDEVDALLKRTGSDLIYTFSRFGEEGAKAMVSLLLISQRKDTLERMDAASLSTFRRTSAVEFPKYSKEELEDILGIRVDLAFFPGAVDREIVELIADLASEGDARYAIEILEKGGLLADEERADAVLPEHVRGARASVTMSDVAERLAQLDRTRQIVLLGIARRIRKKTYITTGEAEEAYELTCEEFHEKPRGHTQFWKYVKDLDALGLIDAKISGEGVVGKTTLISVPEVPAKVLADNLERMLKRT